MATIASEQWTATSTTTWPAQWTAGINQGTASVANSRGRLLPSGTAYKTIRRLISGAGTSTAKRRITGTFIMSAITEQYIRISGRETVGATGAYPTGYYVRIDPSAGTWKIYGGYGTGEYGDAAAVTMTMVAGNVYGYTIDVDVATTSARIWNVTAGQTEPTTWQSTWTDSDYAGDGGVPALSQQSGNTTNPYVEFGPVTVTDGAGTSYTGSVALSGTGTLTRSGTPKHNGSRGYTGVGTLTIVGSIPFAITSPANNSSINTLRPQFAGTGTPGATLDVYSDRTGFSIGTATVDTYGRWSFTATSDIDQGASSYSAYQDTPFGYANVAITAPYVASLALNGAGSLDINGQPAIVGQVNVGSGGTLALSGQPAIGGALELNSIGTLESQGSASTSGHLDLTGTGTLTATGTARIIGDLAFLNAGTLNITGTPAASAHLDLTGSGSLNYATNGSASGALTLGGSGQLSVTGVAYVSASVAFGSDGMVNGAGSAAVASVLTLTGVGALSVSSKQTSAAVISARLEPRRNTAHVQPRNTSATLGTRTWKAGIDAHHPA